MELTIRIEDDEMLSHIERLRGALTPQQFVNNCFVAGVRQAEARYQREQGFFTRANDGAISLGSVPEHLAKIDRQTVLASIKTANQNDPLFSETKKLIVKYGKLMQLHSWETGRPIASITHSSLAPIQQVAVEAALHGLKQAEAVGKDNAVKRPTKH